MKRRTVTVLFVALFLLWNMVTYMFLAARPENKIQEVMPQRAADDSIMKRLGQLEVQLKSQRHEREQLQALFIQLQAQLRAAAEHPTVPIGKPVNVEGGAGEEQPVVVQQPPTKQPVQHLPIQVEPGNGEEDPGQAVVDMADPASLEDDQTVLPVLVIACNRVTINLNLDELLEYRPSAERFPIIVSQDCGHQATAQVIKSYGPQVTHIQHPDLSDIPLPPKEKKFKDYHKIARHYKWALNQVFHRFNHSAVIIVEDDLNVSEDFFEYFAATYPILKKDPSLWCVSGWNDNGKGDMISDEAELLYRTDFFPGLGWMMERKTWLELESKWPDTFWDDWMRHPDQRRDRACIRPEISRTNTFGKVGVSKGQFFEKYLKFIRLNEKYVPFTKMDLSYLLKEKYDAAFVKTVYNAPLLTVAQVVSKTSEGGEAVRVQYNDARQFKTYAKQLGIMDDLKSGVPRAGYRGVVSFIRNGRRVYFAPPATWTKYDPSWT